MKTYTALYITYRHDLDSKRLEITLRNFLSLGTAPGISLYTNRNETLHELKDSTITIDGHHVLITGYEYVADYDLYDSQGSIFVSPKLSEEDFNAAIQKVHIPKWAYGRVDKQSFWDRIKKQKVPYYKVLNAVYYKLKPEPFKAEYYVYDNITILESYINP